MTEHNDLYLSGPLRRDEPCHEAASLEHTRHVRTARLVEHCQEPRVRWPFLLEHTPEEPGDGGNSPAIPPQRDSRQQRVNQISAFRFETLVSRESPESPSSSMTSWTGATRRLTMVATARPAAAVEADSTNDPPTLSNDSPGR